eukprot:CAMPEP_0115722246 /NCGR_PEP_ID=MMETSP0272-20121206/79569_1 /TAXON_ID=71861 /ORGANISM="Scrippsiella trochoidea, Strain CCMP3099" /LENGTH=128 /DNA_ID=CAMNT_0003165243 /DNA_START=353 /DNA_END=739 /DNA_ORIENTATION=-
MLNLSDLLRQQRPGLREIPERPLPSTHTVQWILRHMDSAPFFALNTAPDVEAAEGREHNATMGTLRAIQWNAPQVCGQLSGSSTGFGVASPIVFSGPAGAVVVVVMVVVTWGVGRTTSPHSYLVTTLK